MRHLIPASIGGGIVGIVLNWWVGRDWAIFAASVAGALSYGLVAYSIWPLISHGPSRSKLAPGLFGIAIFCGILFTYVPLNIALGRPDWFMNGWPFYVYMASYGGLIGAIGTHLYTLGEVQGKARPYLIALLFFVAISIVSAVTAWYFTATGPNPWS